MSFLPVIHKTRLTKDQTYFVHADDLERLLSDSPIFRQIELNFSDDPSLYKSNYDRYVKQEGRLVILSVRYTPPAEDGEAESASADTRPYRITVYATVKALREDLIAQFESGHFATLKQWLGEPRDNVWLQTAHAIQFLINVETEEVEIAYDIDFDSYGRHSHKQRFRTAIRRH
jgi:hypothetical protein